MKNECSVIRDLLPLYLEGMVSSDTADYIKAHLDTCAECAAELKALSNASKVESVAEEKNTDDNNDTAALKTVKRRFRRKRVFTILTSVVLTLAVVFACISLWPASIDYGTSEVYTKEDMDSAIELIKETFNTWDGCKLYSISYTDDSLCERELDYCNTLADDGVTYSECIVFRMQFRSPIFGGGAWNANFRYNWSWYLARTQGGDWELLTWGMP